MSMHVNETRVHLINKQYLCLDFQTFLLFFAMFRLQLVNKKNCCTKKLGYYCGAPSEKILNCIYRISVCDKNISLVVLK